MSESVSLPENLLAAYLDEIDKSDEINLAALRGTSEGTFNPTINNKLLELLKSEKSQNWYFKRYCSIISSKWNHYCLVPF